MNEVYDIDTLVKDMKMLGNKYDIILRDLGASAGLSILLFHLLNLVMQHF